LGRASWWQFEQLFQLLTPLLLLPLKLQQLLLLVLFQQLLEPLSRLPLPHFSFFFPPLLLLLLLQLLLLLPLMLFFFLLLPLWQILGFVVYLSVDTLVEVLLLAGGRTCAMLE